MLKERDVNDKLVIIEPHEYDFGKYTFEDATANGDIVSIGDNLVFHKLREYYNEDKSNPKTPKQIYDEIQDTYKEIDEIKKQPNSAENREKLKILNHKITDILFVKDIVNVKVTNKNHYQDIALRGFKLNGIKYKRLCCGSGQMRRNTVTFVNEELYKYLVESLMCGLQGRIESVNLAKFSAYFALAFSSVLWVRKPRICVIKDYETVIPNQKIDFITEKEGKKSVEERVMDITLNSADGMGIISPQCAKWFSEDIGLENGQVACQFVIRSCFVKGCLVTFDFAKYAKEVCGVNTIKSIYGEEFDIDAIDVLLSESQFKMHGFYNSIKEYTEFHDKYNLMWGVARYNKIVDDDYSLLNYQYIQNNNLDDDALNELIKPTTEWLKKVCSGDDVYSLLYTLGCKKEDETYNAIMGNCGSLFSKAIFQNVEMLNDGYIKRKIYNSIKESFRQAKIGRVWCRGNYQFMVSDPVPLIRNALGLPPTGLIPANHVYSNYWNQCNPEEIDLMRSPMVDKHEHNIVKLANSTEMQNWYKYLYSGVVYSIYDTSTIRHSDSDFDGDIVFSTNNKQLINGAFRDNNPITYDKKKAPEMSMTYENIVMCDLNGFDTLVGQITNKSTSIHAMLPNFNADKYPEQYNELINRLKILREIIGSEIDKIKLGVSPEFPKEWVNRVNIDKNDDDIVKAIKYKHNSLVVNKKAYFMIYIYDNLMRSYKNHVKQFDNDSRNKYSISYLDLKYLKDKSKEQQKLIKRCEYFSPILDTPCSMNKLCHRFEKLEKGIIHDENSYDSILPHFNKRKYNINNATLNELELLYKQYQSQRKFAYIKHILEDSLSQDDFQEYMSDMLEVLNKEYSEKCYSLVSNDNELFEYLLALAERYISANKGFDYSFIWAVLGEAILAIIPRKSVVCIEDSSGVEYLGKHYSIYEVIDVSDNLE